MTDIFEIKEDNKTGAILYRSLCNNLARHDISVMVAKQLYTNSRNEKDILIGHK